jgi:hypothetical protein
VGYEGAMNGFGAPHGKGIRVDVDGSRYEGDWVDGKKEGKGVLVRDDGMRYEGEWVNDKPKGEGTLTDRNGTILFEGKWIDGMSFLSKTMMYTNYWVIFLFL